MKCLDRAVLNAKRNKLLILNERATPMLNAGRSSADADFYGRLRAAADDAWNNFNDAVTELRQHQDRHTVPN
jgi:hypothetical protein